MLTELLPRGTVEVGEARGTESGTPQLRLLLDDGHGQVQYLFWIMRFGGAAAGCPSVATGGDACTETTRPDGDHLTLYQAATRGGEPAGSKMWSALLTGHGYQMLLEEWNRDPQDRSAPITRTDPPLTPDQLAAVVTDPRWKQVAAALPGSPTPPLPSGSPKPPVPGQASPELPVPGESAAPGWTVVVDGPAGGALPTGPGPGVLRLTPQSPGAAEPTPASPTPAP
ncbi:hypothetical protein ACFRMQ_10005 [Kitasatospora sp. NPDC056783]|uniref:hypothetical protein n=1 Tax=Kitasatospora sp. NPDC056783 TaxID=3345943 RepID=UPI00369ADD60